MQSKKLTLTRFQRPGCTDNPLTDCKVAASLDNPANAFNAGYCGEGFWREPCEQTYKHTVQALSARYDYYTAIATL